MKVSIGRRGLVAAMLSAGAIALLGGVGSSAAATPTAVTRTFSFIMPPNNKAANVINIDSLTVSARCDTKGSPIVFAFTSASAADIFGRVFDGSGRVHIIHNTVFNSKSKGILLSPTTNDFDSTGSILFESSTGQVVTISLAMDNSTTLNKKNVCTIFGSYVAS
jgi:hypothetical protein